MDEGGDNRIEFGFIEASTAGRLGMDDGECGFEGGAHRVIVRRLDTSGVVAGRAIRLVRMTSCAMTVRALLDALALFQESSPSIIDHRIADPHRLGCLRWGGGAGGLGREWRGGKGKGFWWAVL